MLWRIHTYLSICHRRIGCHGNQMIDMHFSDILHFQLVRGIVLISKCYSYYDSQIEIVCVSGQHICEF